MAWDALTMVLRREVKPGDWTSHWRATERGRHALDLLCGERGREEEGVVGGSWGALGPMPSFSLMAGERMEVKDENIANSPPEAAGLWNELLQTNWNTFNAQFQTT